MSKIGLFLEIIFFQLKVQHLNEVVHFTLQSIGKQRAWDEANSNYFSGTFIIFTALN